MGRAHRQAEEVKIANAAAAEAVAREEEKEAAMIAAEREAESGLREIPTTSQLPALAPVLKNPSGDAGGDRTRISSEENDNDFSEEEDVMSVESENTAKKRSLSYLIRKYMRKVSQVTR